MLGVLFSGMGLKFRITPFLTSIFVFQVNLKANDLKAEFTKALRTTTLPLSHHGPSAMVQIGHVGMAKEHITQNLMKVTEVLEKRFPGGWKNIRSIHIKTEKSLAIPMYLSEGNFSQLDFLSSYFVSLHTLGSCYRY